LRRRPLIHIASAVTTAGEPPLFCGQAARSQVSTASGGHPPRADKHQPDSMRATDIHLTRDEQPADSTGARNDGTLDLRAKIRCPHTAIVTLLDNDTFEPLPSAEWDGVVAGTGTVNGRSVCVWAQDVHHRGGSLGAAGGETIAETIKLASDSGVPVIGLPHSGGARLQEGVAALAAYAAIFREQAHARVPQITLVRGPCAGGAAYSPALSDFVLMCDDARLFLTGPRVVEQVMREQITSEGLGGPKVHANNGVAHLFAPTDHGAVAQLRELMSYLPTRLRGPLPVVPVEDSPAGNPADHLPTSTRLVYDVRDVIRGLVDGGRHLELSGRWARNMVTTLARIDGSPIGVIANQPRHLGGTIDAAASDKGAWFVELCDRLGLPLVVLVDTPGFLPGKRQEQAGVIRRGAGLLRAFARATTPRLTVTLRQAYGGAHIVMNSRDLGANLTLAWPGAKVGIMGAAQAVAIIHRKEIAAGSNSLEAAERYESTKLVAETAAAEGFIDEIVSPGNTRERLRRALTLYR
jgi:acetyl-CoA carboxylase carboxyltransferase component